jgi:hypothetical protein
MNGTDAFRRAVAVITIVAAMLAIASIPTSMAWMAPDLSSAFTDPAAGLRSGPGRETVARISMLLDMLGYYLLLVPVALYLRAWLRPRSTGLADVSTVAGLSYALIGAGGAAVLAMAAPYLLETYAVADGAHREAIEVVYPTLLTAVQHGLWMTLDPILAGVWWMGIGSLLIAEHRVLGWFTVVLGVLALVLPVGMALDVSALGPSGLGGLWGVLQLVWMMWIGVTLLRAPAAANVGRLESAVPSVGEVQRAVRP